MRPDFWTTAAMAAALAVVFEGLLYALLAAQLPGFARILADTPPSRIRRVGLAAAGLGLLSLVVMRLQWFG